MPEPPKLSGIPWFLSLMHSPLQKSSNKIGLVLPAPAKTAGESAAPGRALQSQPERSQATRPWFLQQVTSSRISQPAITSGSDVPPRDRYENFCGAEPGCSARCPLDSPRAFPQLR